MGRAYSQDMREAILRLVNKGYSKRKSYGLMNGAMP